MLNFAGVKVHLFNPENDLALAANCLRYTPPAAARAVAEEGTLLPLLWAADDDVVIASPTHPRLAQMRRLGLKAEVVSKVSEGVDGCEPWGWSLDARRRLAEAGVDSAILPDDQRLAAWRQLSHRRTARELRRLLGEHETELPVEAHSVEEALDTVGRFGGDAYIKQPWSGSGRGVFRTAGMDAATLSRYAAGFIRRQGSLMVELARDRVGDFAMLFHAAADGRVEFRGLSAFLTDDRGAYRGNLVAPQAEIVAAIGIDPRYLAADIERHLSVLIAGSSYCGWIGVDMLTYRTAAGMEIQPAVEINFRRTMGTAALAAHARLGIRATLTAGKLLF